MSGFTHARKRGSGRLSLPCRAAAPLGAVQKNK